MPQFKRLSLIRVSLQAALDPRKQCYVLAKGLCGIRLADFAEQKNGAILDFTQFYETWRFCIAI